MFINLKCLHWAEETDPSSFNLLDVLGGRLCLEESGRQQSCHCIGHHQHRLLVLVSGDLDPQGVGLDTFVEHGVLWHA